MDVLCVFKAIAFDAQSTVERCQLCIGLNIFIFVQESWDAMMPYTNTFLSPNEALACINLSVSD